YLLATRHAERQELDEAITLFGELSEEFPDNVLIHYSLGVANLLQGDTSGARDALERVIAIDPQYINAYVNLATVYEQRGELGRAIELLEGATEIAPGSVAATRARTRLDIIEGDLLSGQGNVHAAIAAYE